MRILALDIGERRIGVAVSDPTGMIARPVGVVRKSSREKDFAAINALVIEHQVERVVVGYPLTLRGEVGPQAQRVERYVEALAQVLPVPLCTWDERYSTVAAQEIIAETRKGKRSRQSQVDAVAAAVILQGFLDNQASPCLRVSASPLSQEDK